MVIVVNKVKSPKKAPKRPAAPKKAAGPLAPKHLRPATKTWYNSVVSTFVLEPHHVHLLGLAATALDRADEARVALAADGLTYLDKSGLPHARPEVAIEATARIAFARILRELGLDQAAAPEAPRPAHIPGGRRASF